MEITTERVDDVVVVKAKGRFYSNDAQAVEAGLAEAIGSGTLRLALDLTEMDYISSAGLRVLIEGGQANPKSEGQGGAVRPAAKCS